MSRCLINIFELCELSINFNKCYFLRKIFSPPLFNPLLRNFHFVMLTCDTNIENSIKQIVVINYNDNLENKNKTKTTLNKFEKVTNQKLRTFLFFAIYKKYIY